jgi:radical SAM protein with 4Fe4S-binding SPASM domain
MMRTLVLFVTDACNLGCTYCYQRRTRHRLEWPETERALEHWFAQSPGPLTVSFFGGEPLLEWDLVRRSIERSRELSQAHGKPVSFAVATNATRMTEEVYALFAEVGMRVQVSIDGPEEVHDRQRGRGTFEQVKASILRLKQVPSIHLKTSTVVTPLNVGDLSRSLAFVWGLDAVEANLRFDFTADWHAEHFDELKRQYVLLIPAALDYHHRHRFFPHTDFQLLPERMFPFKCDVGQRTLTLRPDGYVYGCNYHAPEWRGRPLPDRPPLAVGTLDEILAHGVNSAFVRDRLKQVNASPYQAPLEARYTDSRKCSTCPYLFRCGACHATAYSHGKDPLWLPESRCRVTELNYRYALLLDRILKEPESAAALSRDFLRDPMKFGRAVEAPSLLLPVLAPASCAEACTGCAH